LLSRNILYVFIEKPLQTIGFLGMGVGTLKLQYEANREFYITLPVLAENAVLKCPVHADLRSAESA
jgi:hypothetical protein